MTLYHKLWLWYHNKMMELTCSVGGVHHHYYRAEYHEGKLEQIKRAEKALEDKKQLITDVCECVSKTMHLIVVCSGKIPMKYYTEQSNYVDAQIERAKSIDDHRIDFVLSHHRKILDSCAKLVRPSYSDAMQIDFECDSFEALKTNPFI